MWAPVIADLAWPGPALIFSPKSGVFDVIDEGMTLC
jgi:hypothetical protein